MPANIWGGGGEVCETKISASYPSQVSDEMWMIFGNPNAWTETGIIQRPGYSPQFFWADQSGKYGFNLHPLNAAPASGGHYSIDIAYSNPPWWSVTVPGGPSGAPSYHDASYGTDLITGGEFDDYQNSGSLTESGATSALSWEDTSGNWWPTWGPLAQAVTGPWDGFWYQPGNYWSEKSANAGWSC